MFAEIIPVSLGVIIILTLIAFIVGLMTGVSMARPGGAR